MIDAVQHREYLARKEQLPSILDELCGAELGDTRRVDRAMSIVRALHDDPSVSFPEATGGDAAKLKALYRFFSNPAVSMTALLAPHFATTWQRVKDIGRCFAIHDSSELTFEVTEEAQNRQGLERASKYTRCLRIHPTLMVAANGSRLPLGLGAMMSWARTEEDAQQRPEHWSEQDRWVEQALTIEKYKDEDKDIDVIHLMDRDADSYDNLAKLLKAGARFVIRMQYDRTLNVDDELTIKQALEKVEKSGRRDIKIGKRGENRSPRDKKKHPPRQARTATVAIRGASVEVIRPDKVSMREFEQLCVNVVEVSEVNRSQEQDKVAWYLLTTEPIDTEEQCWDVVDSYCTRWTIEEYFHALKTGCAVEERQLQSRDALEAMLGVMLPMAWRVLLMRYLPRVAPDAPATNLLSPTEIDVLQAAKPKMVPESPTIKQVCLAVAALGGHLKRSGPPGWKTLWKGIRKLKEQHRGYLLALQRYG